MQSFATAGPQMTDIFGGMIDYLLLYLTTKQDFENFCGGNCPVAPWLQAWQRPLAVYRHMF